MKTLLSIIIFIALFNLTYATNYTINYSIYSYMPNFLAVKVGDQVTISASTAYPWVQVDKATWNANGSSPMSGGWGTKTADYVFTATAVDTIYFVCSTFAGSYGMKGMIIVQNAAGINNQTIGSLNFNIYPNPVVSTSILKLNFPEATKISINLYNINGQLEKIILSEADVIAGKYQYSFDVSNIDNGIYFVDIINNHNHHIKKMIVAK